jgi:hypothetical protein
MDDFPDETQETNEDGKPIVRHVVRDLAAAVAMRRLAARADERARRAEAKAMAETRRIEAQADLAKIKAEERQRKHELKSEIAKMRLNRSAVETSRTVAAITSPFLLAILIGGFIAALASGRVPEEATATSATLLTLVCTALLANLRSVISNEGNVDEVKGNGNGKPKPTAPKPERKNPLA